jgi:hypothetical protein
MTISSGMPSPDSDVLSNDYARDGFVFPVPILTATQADDYCRRLEALEHEYRRTLPVDRYLKFDPHYLLPVIDELVHLPRLLDFVTAILGPNLMVSNTNVFLKEANSPDHISWHQDLYYIGLDGDDFVTVWLALTPATSENGCMQFLRGSHRGSLPHHDTYDEHNMLTRGQAIEVNVEPSKVTEVLLEPGQASMHHGWMAHASAPNRSDQRRVGLVIRYMAPHLRQTLAERDYAILVRGEDRHHNFVAPPRPTADFQPEAIERYEAIREERRRFLYSGAEQVRD